MTESSLAAIGALQTSEGYQSLLSLLDAELESEVAALLGLTEPAAILAAHAKSAALSRVIGEIRSRVSRYAHDYSASNYPDPVGT